MHNKFKEIIEKRIEFVKRDGSLRGNWNWVYYCFGYVVYAIQILIARLLIKPNKNNIGFVSLVDYSDNARALSEYLVSTKQTNYRIFWFVNDVQQNRMLYKNDNIVFVSSEKKNNHFSWETIRAAYSCGIICYTHTFIIKRKHLNPNQKFINLWHGCGYKAVEKKNVNPEFDYLLVPGNIFVETKKDFFGIDKDKIWAIGYPRYDYLKSDSEKAEKFIMQIKRDNKKIVMWMPTFRNTGKNIFPEEKNIRDFELPILLNELELEDLNHYCQKSKIIICIKRHPMQKRYECEKKEYTNIIFINNEDLKKEDIELYSILHYTDALISDYSSISVDYMLLNKPIAYSLDDFKQYNNSRGFVFENPLEYMSGHHLYNMDDLLSFLEDVCSGRDIYVDKRALIMSEFHNLSDNYCKTVWDQILEIV